MNERRWMELAVELAAKCQDESSERSDPKVGAVVVKDDKLLASAYRGECEPGQHAEFTALEVKLADRDVSGATVYTTLEPCTTRNHPKVPCAERLLERKVVRVVIGMLDPNKEIRGRGEWSLLEHNVEIGRFAPDLTKQLMEMNRAFIREQQRLGVRITYPENGIEWHEKYCTLKGTFINRPGDNVLVITNIGDEWWPQLFPFRIVENESNTWEAQIDFGKRVPHKVYVVKASELAMQLISFYKRQVIVRHQVIEDVSNTFSLDREKVRMAVSPCFWSLSMPRLPKGLDVEDCITVDVKDIAN